VALVLVAGRDAWAQVTESLKAKSWVRLILQIPADAAAAEGIPEEILKQPPQIWLSLPKQIAASRFMQASHYCDFARQESCRYEPKEKAIYCESTSDVDHIVFEHFDTLLRLVAAGDRQLKLPESPIKIIERSQIEVRDGNRQLTEFAFKLRDARRTPGEYTTTVLVDPESRLPLTMSTTEKVPSIEKEVTRTYAFEYPETGPADIYALGVPRTATIVDWRRPSNAKEIYAAYSKAREKRIEPYWALVLMSDAQAAFKDVFEAYRVRYDGQRWLFAQAEPQAMLDFRKSIWEKQLVLPKDVDPVTWWKEQVEKLPFTPLEVVEHPEHRAPIPDRVGYKPLGDPSAPGGQITIDLHPRSGPPETIRYGVRTTIGVNDFWIAPEHGHLIEPFESVSPEAADWKVFTIVIDKAEKSPGGAWYATEARLGNVQNSGDDLPTQRGVGPVSTSVFRYFVEFDEPSHEGEPKAGPGR
jgi:hypothetical protein